MGNAVAKTETGQSVATVEQITPMQMLQVAVDRGDEMEKLTQLMDLQDRWEAKEAKKAYTVAMAAFKAETIHIVKDKLVNYTTQKGNTRYRHASLHNIVMAASPKLSEHGLSHRWVTAQGDGGIITVTCVITHKMGHSEETALSSGPDQSGGKNNIQAVASTVSYLERYTFMAATGLTAEDMDDDGVGSGQPQETEYISETQIANLEAMISEIGCDKDGFLKLCKIESLKEMPAVKYSGAVSRLNAKRKEAAG